MIGRDAPWIHAGAPPLELQVAQEWEAAAQDVLAVFDGCSWSKAWQCCVFPGEAVADRDVPRLLSAALARAARTPREVRVARRNFRAVAGQLAARSGEPRDVEEVVPVRGPDFDPAARVLLACLIGARAGAGGRA